MSGDTSLPAKCRCYFVFILYISSYLYMYNPLPLSFSRQFCFPLMLTYFPTKRIKRCNTKQNYRTTSLFHSLSSPWIKLGPIELPIKNDQDKVNCYGKPIKMDTYPVSRKQRGTLQPVSGSRPAHPLFQLNLSIGHSIRVYIKNLY